MNIAPVLGGMSDLLATQGGRLLAFDLAGHTLRWTQQGTFGGNVTVANGTLYVFNNQQIEARRESDGGLLWVWVPPNNERPTGTMIATNNLLFVSTGAATYAVDLAAHKQVWSYPASGLLALGQQGTLFVAQANGKLAALSVR